MKRKNRNNGPVVDLRAFMERSAAKKRQTENQTENQMQLVVFQGESGSGIAASTELGRAVANYQKMMNPVMSIMMMAIMTLSLILD